MTPTRQRLPWLLVVLALLAIFVPMLFRRADAATPAVATVVAGPDFATNAFHDPWDMSNAADMDLDPLGATLYVTNQSLSGGAARFSTSKVSYATLLWSGVPGSLPWGRDGRLARNRIAASSYPRLHAHVYASTATSVRVQWSQTCSGCTGYYPLTLQAGWNDVDIALTGSKAVGTAWSGSIDDLRLTIMTAHATSLAIDFVRLYRPVAAGVVHWAAAGAGAATLRWSDTGSFVAGDGVDSGTVPGTTSANSSDVRSVDLSGWAPGTTFFAYDGARATEVAQVAREPLPVLDAPTSAGCAGTTWRFPSSGSTAGVFNAMGVSYSSGGVLTATNAPPQRNDPHVLMPLSSTGFDGRAYHRVTVVESYDGSFNLADAPGGGTMGRLLWREPGHVALSQTPPLVTPTGVQSIALDMNQPISVITDPTGTAAMRYAFASTSPVNQLRWDPNEDPGSRRWHLYSVRIAKDCATKTAYSVVWHDAAFSSGNTATVVAVTPGGHTHLLASNLAETMGSNSLRIYAASVPAGTWSIRVTVTSPSGATHTTQDGPLVVG